MYILGINAWHGDASATLIKNGEVILAVEEERLNRKKHYAGFPTLSIKACLDKANISITDVAHICTSTKPSANLKQKVLYSLKRVTRIHSMLRDRIGKVAKTKDLRTILADELGVAKEDLTAEIHNIEHHLAHMASAFFVSPFDDAAILSLDGMGDFVSAKWGEGSGTTISTEGQIEYPHSMGFLYTAITQFLGFPHYGDEGKVMGLAPYGKPEYMDQFRELLKTYPDKMGYELNLTYFRHHAEGIQMQWDDGPPSIGKMYSEKMTELLGPARKPKTEITEKHQNIAASLQLRIEEVAFDLLQKLQKSTGKKALCLAGGVSLNSVMNGKILMNTDFEDVYIHPNAGDGGTSLGAAFYVYNQLLSQERKQPLEHAYLGLSFSDDEISEALKNAVLESKKLTSDELYTQTAKEIADGNVVGWFQGEMEWGPRALGNRSIVADPRRSDMKDVLNARIKRRESFRPFAPSVLEEHTSNFFEQDYPAPAMLMVYQVREEKRKLVPAITHVDGSGRLQTVRKEHNERYYKLISAFHKLTEVPMLLNTSFNENEPVVCRPEEAIDCFLRTKMDVLAIGNYLVRKKDLSDSSQT